MISDVSLDAASAALRASEDMSEPVAGVVELEVPAQELWELFRRAHLWPRWNRCFLWALNRDLVLGRQLIWVFRPIRWWMLYVMPAIAKIVELVPGERVTWQVTALPGFFAHHTYHVRDLGNGRSEFGSWEKAMGWSFRRMRWFWIPHFVFVKDRSLEGARALEALYRREGRLRAEDLPRGSARARAARWLLAVLVAIALAAGIWLYRAYVRETTVALAPGIDAVLGGGSNTLVVRSDAETVLIDPKFPPGSLALRRSLARGAGGPVRIVIDTHYHYDHTQGNALYEGAEIYAASGVAELLREQGGSFNDPAFWREHSAALPGHAVQDTLRIDAAGAAIVLHAVAGAAHTRADLWAYLPGSNLVVTGDVLVNGYYPFLDLSPAGASLPGLIALLRGWVERFPDATFVPGHGPPCGAPDVARFADYLEALWTAARRAREAGWTEDQAAERIDLSAWRLQPLPSLLRGTLLWATEESNVRWAYRLAARERAADALRSRGGEDGERTRPVGSAP